MNAATAESLVGRGAARSLPAARRLVLVVLAASGVLGLVLLTASLVPSTALAGRILSAIGETRTGLYTQDLLTYLDARLRFAGTALLALTAALALTRRAVEDLVSAGLRDTRWTITWPRTASIETWLTIAGLTLLAAALRIPFLAQPMRYDEALTFNEFASRALYYGLSFYPDPNNHLLNTLLMHGAAATLGNQPWVLRLPAFVAGVLLAPATCALAGALEPSAARVGVLAGVLVAVSSYLVEYSTNARGYTLQALAFVVMLTLVLLAVRRGSPGALLLAALVAALGAYAVPTMLYGVAIAGVWLLLRMRRPLDGAHVLASALVLGLGALVLYLPVVIVSGADKLVANRFVAPLGLDELARELPASLARTWSFWNRDVPWPLAALLVFGFLIATAEQVQRRRVPIGLLAIGICLCLVLLQRVAPFERVWLFLLPLYFAIAAAGLTRLADGRLLALVFGVVLAFVTLTSGSILSSGETGAFPDAEPVARGLAVRLAPDDAVLTMLPASLPELQYYFPRSGLSTAVLVRSPDAAQRLWVVDAPDATPRVEGWRSPTEVERFSGSALFELQRANPSDADDP